MKELTPEELTKTENFAKACRDILKSEQEDAEAALSETLSFGIASDKRNASLPLIKANKINNQLDVRSSNDRSKRSQSGTKTINLFCSGVDGVNKF